MRPNKARALSLLLCVAAGAVIAALTITRPEPASVHPPQCTTPEPGYCVELKPLTSEAWWGLVTV